MGMFTTDRPAFTLQKGSAPLLVSMPHVGTYVPPGLAPRFTEEARGVPDTDWHLERLYDFVHDMGASVLAATHSRYVVDLNRPPDGSSLYPGQSVTALCPIDTFDDTPVYLDANDVPDAAETAERVRQVWQPYHAALRAELARLLALHGRVLLWEAHSIRSVLPRFFEGRLPDFNLGSAKGASCAATVALAAERAAQAASAQGYTSVLNGRFTGGYITRHYGQPESGIHAVQLEMTQSSYMEEVPPYGYLAEVAGRVQPALRAMVSGAFEAMKALG